MGIERRQFPRVTLICRVTITCGERRSKVYNSHSENVSAGGIRIILDENLIVRTPLELELFLPDREKSLKCKGQVVWVREMGPPTATPHFYDTGIEFKEMEESDQHILTEAISTMLMQVQRYAL